MSALRSLPNPVPAKASRIPKNFTPEIDCLFLSAINTCVHTPAVSIFLQARGLGLMLHSFMSVIRECYCRLFQHLFWIVTWKPEMRTMKKTFRVCGIVGSPKKNGNVDLLVAQVLKGASIQGAGTQKIYLNDLHIKPCQSCGIDPYPKYNWSNAELVETILYAHDDDELGSVKKDEKQMSRAFEIGVRIIK